jgi:hypothetical protein
LVRYNNSHTELKQTSYCSEPILNISSLYNLCQRLLLVWKYCKNGT